MEVTLEFAGRAPCLFDEVASGVIFKLFITLDKQAITLHEAMGGVFAVVLDEQVARRIETEKVRMCAFATFETVKVVVEIVAFTITVFEAIEVAVLIVNIVSLDKAVFIMLVPGVLAAEAALGIIISLGVEQALLALLLAAKAIALNSGHTLLVVMDLLHSATGMVAIVDTLARGQGGLLALAIGAVLVLNHAFSAGNSVAICAKIGLNFSQDVAEGIIFKTQVLLCVADFGQLVEGIVTVVADTGGAIVTNAPAFLA